MSEQVFEEEGGCWEDGPSIEQVGDDYVCGEAWQGADSDDWIHDMRFVAVPENERNGTVEAFYVEIRGLFVQGCDIGRKEGSGTWNVWREGVEPRPEFGSREEAMQYVWDVLWCGGREIVVP